MFIHQPTQIANIRPVKAIFLRKIIASITFAMLLVNLFLNFKTVFHIKTPKVFNFRGSLQLFAGVFNFHNCVYDDSRYLVWRKDN